MNRATSVLVQLVGLFLPADIKRALLTSTLGWTIGRGTTIGCSILLDCGHVKIGSGCRIGHFNMFRGLKTMEIGDDTRIGNFNDFMAGNPSVWPASLWIGHHAHVTSRHFFDCSGGIRLGDFCLVGGRDSHLWTHFYDSVSVQDQALSIGDRCYVCARATLVYCHIPNDCVIGAGAVVTGDFTGEGSGLLLAGNPARVKKRMVAT